MKKKKETPMHPVVENIRKIIMDKGITQVAASELVGTSASQMSKILNGEVQISIWQISNFATNLGMEIIDVFTYPNKYVKAEDRNDNKEPIEAVLQIKLRKDKKDQVLKLIFGEHNLKYYIYVCGRKS